MVFPYQHQSPPPPGPVIFSHLVSEFSLHSFFDSKQPPDPQYTIFFFVASTSSIAGIAINPVTNTAPSATNSVSIRVCKFNITSITISDTYINDPKRMYIVSLNGIKSII